MEIKRAENREGSLEYPWFVTPVFTHVSKPLGKRKISLGHLGIGKPESPKESQTTPELQRRKRTVIWHLLPKETDEAQHQTCLVSSFQLPLRQFQGRLRTDCVRLGHIGLYARRPTNAFNWGISPCMFRFGYQNVILDQLVRLSGTEFLFMNDNDRPHRANIADECLQLENITRMVWPAYSPDLNQ
ncbi:transposable element Tcb2 transposase [Trichonephila clavipes]|nr:transposable element Tcb2 transposase [Trichonephila clavipes]